MKNKTFKVLAILVFLTAGCVTLPTLEPTLTPLPTLTPAPTETPLPTLPASVGSLGIVGNVWLRDSVGNKAGWLMAGARLEAECSGEWCHAAGLKFWRGCTDNNPDNLTCRMEE